MINSRLSWLRTSLSRTVWAKCLASRAETEALTVLLKVSQSIYLDAYQPIQLKARLKLGGSERFEKGDEALYTTTFFVSDSR
mmetsp:Transcript_8303/g.12278  ORF Transcript_8303/g.12278 Transcript_8303/m.12278 type:complete len:82 (-) Transcript_8303:91-336(-)